MQRAFLVALMMRISRVQCGNIVERWWRCEICIRRLFKTVAVEIRRDNGFEGEDGFLRCLLSGRLVEKRNSFRSGGNEDRVDRSLLALNSTGILYWGENKIEFFYQKRRFGII